MLEPDLGGVITPGSGGPSTNSCHLKPPVQIIKSKILINVWIGIQITDQRVEWHLKVLDFIIWYPT